MAATPPTNLRGPALGAGVVLMLVALWAVTHRYKGLSGDAELYGVQALAKVYPALAHDLFLQYTSQDKFTIFSPFYAACISIMGLRTAAMCLAIAFKIWFFAAAWLLARSFFDSRLASVSTAFLIVIVGGYGGGGVFHYAEDWLTARSMGEALVITSLALFFRGRQRSGLLTGLAALLVHPLMALPGLLLILCMSAPFRTAAIGAAIGLLACCGIALYGLHIRSPVGPFQIIDGDWLEVVRERSVFLFPHLWNFGDWTMNVKPFVSLLVSTLTVPDPRIRKYCYSASLIGIAGFAVAFVGSLLGPIAILLQCQAWRWDWMTSFAAILFLAPTLVILWRGGRTGPLAAILLILAWTYSAVNGTACAAGALILWSLRARVSDLTSRYLRWAAFAAAGIVLGWAIATAWSTAVAPPPESGLDSKELLLLRNIFGLGVVPVAVAMGLTQAIFSGRRALVLSVCFALAASCAILVPSALAVRSLDGSAALVHEFSDWRAAIPESANVLVVPVHNSDTFAWFTLQRASYLSVDQSAGVVFSKDTAREVRRRSQVLLPLMAPNWMLYSRLKNSESGNVDPQVPSTQLTPARLAAVCKDPILGFVVAREDVGFSPLHHASSSAFRDWNLYDCRRVRAETSS